MVRVALTAVETWTQGDKIVVDEDSDKSLQNFMKYRNSDLVKKYPHDNAQLLTWVWWKHGNNKQTLYIEIFELLKTNTVCV